jgi:hypothetical protein
MFSKQHFHHTVFTVSTAPFLPHRFSRAISTAPFLPRHSHSAIYPDNPAPVHRATVPFIQRHFHRTVSTAPRARAEYIFPILFPTLQGLISLIFNI